MNSFGPYPFVRLLLPFLSGILIEIGFDLPDYFTGTGFLFLFVFYVLDFYWKNIFGEYRFRYVNGTYLMVLLFLAGSFWTSLFDDRKMERHAIHFTGSERVFSAEIIAEPVEKEKSVKAEIRLLEYTEGGENHPVSGTALLYLKKNDASLALDYGDRIIIKGRLQEIQAPQNPGEFDYKSYCANKHIYTQLYADEFHWKKSGQGGNFIYKTAFALRKKLLEVIRLAGLEGQEYAVASALILGYTGEIDSVTRSAYSASGALHVLSVSGLHVAIIFVVFDKLFLFLLLFRRGKYYKAVLILLLLWIYALLTGLSPSVIRSATMLSFIIIGKLIQRNASIYNSICASAFLILCFDPYIITDVGFQLSYLAVFGIVYLHPKVYQLFFISNRIGDFVWNITAVSIAAQLITFPLGLFYFHQFPNYFLVANLAVIPLGTVILYAGVAALVFSSVPYINDFLFFLLEWSVKLLNKAVSFTEQLPYSVSKGVFISAFETLLIYGVLFSFLFFRSTKKPYWLKIALASASLLFIGFSIQKFQQRNNRKMIVYSISGESALEVSYGNSVFFIASENLHRDQNKIQFHIQNCRDMMGISEVNTVVQRLFSSGYFYRCGNYFACAGKKGLIIDKNFKSFPASHKLKVNYILLTQNAGVKLHDINAMYDYEMLILDKSNSAYRIRKWKKETGEEKIHIMAEKGALIINL